MAKSPLQSGEQDRPDKLTGWSGRVRLWIEIEGGGTIGPGKLRLLEALARTQSLAEAAKSERMSYRYAWKHLKLLEQRTGLQLVERRRGGQAGGGTALTPDGCALLEAYLAWREAMRRDAEDSFRRHFAALASPRPSTDP